MRLLRQQKNISRQSGVQILWLYQAKTGVGGVRWSPWRTTSIRLRKSSGSTIKIKKIQNGNSKLLQISNIITVKNSIQVTDRHSKNYAQQSTGESSALISKHQPELASLVSCRWLFHNIREQTEKAWSSKDCIFTLELSMLRVPEESCFREIGLGQCWKLVK